MSVFGKGVDQITTADLAELLDGGAMENVRLEFKREAPPKDETLKKLSSFANTFGGLLIIGAEAPSDDGRLTAMPGVAEISGFRQRIIQWLFDGVYPPLDAQVSAPILVPGNASRYAYIVSIEESDEAPHFLEGRKGVYVRSDEFSQRFRAELATSGELARLTNRRAALTERKNELARRARRRFEDYARLQYSTSPNTAGSLGATLHLHVTPVYPSRHLVPLHELHTIVTETRVDWRQVGFPRVHDVVTQHESVLLLCGAWDFSLVEATAWGSLTYTREVEEHRPDNAGGTSVAIHLNSFVGHLLVFVQHAGTVLRKLGYSGSVELRLELNGVRELPFVEYPSNVAQRGPSSPIDDNVDFTSRLNGSQLTEKRDPVVKELLRTLLFALNWEAQARDEAVLERIIQNGHWYNFWRGAAPR